MKDVMIPAQIRDATNLALGKPANQSSTCEWSHDAVPAEDAKGANNGIISGEYGFHTATENYPWWDVDLQSEYAIDKVVIYNRRAEAARLRRFSVLTSLDNVTWDEAFKKTDASVFGDGVVSPYTVDLKGTPVARYIRIRLDGLGCLHFVECQVYGHEAGAATRANFFIRRSIKRALRRARAKTRSGHVMGVGGFEIFVDEVYHPGIVQAFENGGYEYRERHLVTSLLRPDDRVLEGGTAAGVVTMTAASIVGDRNVTTFEANPHIARDARANFARNGLKDIALHVGILQNRGSIITPGATVKFYIDELFVASRLEANLGDPGIIGVVELPTFCLEDELEKSKATVLILDIEGGEVELLHGAELENIRMIIMELHHQFAGSEPTDAMIEYLIKGGFVLDLAHSGDQMVVLCKA